MMVSSINAWSPESMRSEKSENIIKAFANFTLHVTYLFLKEYWKVYVQVMPRFTELPDPDPPDSSSEQRSAMAFWTAGQAAACKKYRS